MGFHAIPPLQSNFLPAQPGSTTRPAPCRRSSALCDVPPKGTPISPVGAWRSSGRCALRLSQITRLRIAPHRPLLKKLQGVTLSVIYIMVYAVVGGAILTLYESDTEAAAEASFAGEVAAQGFTAEQEAWLIDLGHYFQLQYTVCGPCSQARGERWTTEVRGRRGPAAVGAGVWRRGRDKGAVLSESPSTEKGGEGDCSPKRRGTRRQSTNSAGPVTNGG